jgi:DNA modification methylase
MRRVRFWRQSLGLAGSGAIVIACKELNRRFVDFEIKLQMAQVAVDRLNNTDVHGQISMLTI